MATEPAPLHRDSLIERVIEWSARNRFMVVLFVAAMVVGGVYCTRKSPLDAIPDLRDVQVIVFSQWEGRSPDLVEDQITYPIVTKLLAGPKVKVWRGFPVFGFSRVLALF